MKDTYYTIIQYLKTKYRKFSNRQALETWQDKQVQKHIRWVLSNSPFYQDYLKGKEPSNWRCFPTINKEIMMDNFDQLNTLGVSKEEAFKVAFKAENSRDFSPMIQGVTVGLSSGTSGNRGLFLVSKKEQGLWSGSILAKLLPHHLLSNKETSVAFFLRANSNLYEEVGKRKIKFQFFDLLDDMKKHVSRLNDDHPTIVVGPPSILRMLAKSKEDGTLLCTPQKIISVAEVLEPMDEQFLEAVFAQKIHQVYQCTEGFLGATCEHGTFHLNEDIVVIEKNYLDKRLGKFTPIITDFSRTTQPIIRYELNDILTEKKGDCPCGSIFMAIEQIEGRCDDIFYFKSKASGSNIAIFPDFIRRAIMSASTDIEEYQAIQYAFDRIEIALITKNANFESVKEDVELKLTQLYNHYAVVQPGIIYSHEIQREKGMKLKRVERKFTIC